MVKIAVKRDHDTITGGLFQFDFAECLKTHNFFTTGAIMKYPVFAGIFGDVMEYSAANRLGARLPSILHIRNHI
jgi:hypothetical protein